ncbi:TetR/AcrR family transcriptional regulator [Paenibacillus campinasensis]|uniref:TetR/AcrR family transcriptional regulator n=1 Tax=Paenibacillus campinasensis TaxID=66347 RepID=UPI0015CA3CC3|nr:TetR family transcriptional regulator [Paenibacillus campinasensis]
MSDFQSSKRTDPRVVRTRQFIQDAFTELLRHKDFHQITISDITSKATINRATFYAHYQDKYELLDALWADGFTSFLLQRIRPDAPLTEETIRQLIHALCDYHQTLNNKCMKNYTSVAPVVEKNIKQQLESFITQLVTHGANGQDPALLKSAATSMSWSIYGVTYQWNLDGRTESPEQLAARILPIMMNGVSALNSNPQPVC